MQLTVTSLLSELCTLYATRKFNSVRSRDLLGVSQRHYQRFLKRAPLVRDLTDENIVSYVEWRRTKQVRPATIDRETCKLLGVWRFAAEPPQLLIPPPTIKLPRARKKPPLAFLDDEVARLFHAAHECERRVGKLPGSIYWPCVLGVIWDCGERIKAIYELERPDVQMANTTLLGWMARADYVTFRSRKGNGDIKTRKLSRRTAKAVRTLLEATDSDKPFAPITLSGIYRSFDSLLKDAGLPHDRWSKFHRLRKSHLSYVYVEGGQEAAIDSAGHSDAKILHDHYLDRRIVRPVDASDLLWDPLSKWPRWLRRRRA